MSDDIDFLDWLDAQDDPAEREAGGWACDTIDRAEAAARRLRRATDAVADMTRTRDRIIADANAWHEHATDRHETIIEIERANLETFLRKQISDGGAKSAPLPWGATVKARKVGGQLEFPDGFADTAPDEVVRVKRSIDAAAAKAFYTVADGGVVVDPNGEVVEGVRVKPVTDKVEVVS